MEGRRSPEKAAETRGKRSSPEKAKETEQKHEQSAPGSSSKRKRKAPAAAAAAPVEVEPRTPLKRQRVPVQKFQSPAEEIIPIPSTSKQKDQTELLHKKGSFLGVRGVEGTFYLCKTIQNVFSNTRKFRIQWLDLVEQPDVYKLDFADSTDADCILTNVKMERVARDTYRIPLKEQNRVEEILHRALKKERGEPIEDLAPIPSGSEDEEEDEDWSEDSPKKPSTKKTTPKEKKAKQTKTDSSKGKKASPVKKEKTEHKKGPDKNLKPNPRIKVLDKDPFFETKEKTEFVSKSNQGKLAIRAVLLNDKKLLQSIIEDKESVYKLNENRSVDVSKNALHYAIEKGDHEAIKILVKDIFSENNERIKKGTPQSVLISSSDKGSYNPMSLGGLGRVRELSQSRGSKQGNDAFIMDQGKEEHELADYMEDALKLGVKKETLNVLANVLPNQSTSMIERAITNVYQAVLCGNRKLAGYLVEEALKESFTGFGFLHKDVLLFDKEDLRQTILAASVKKKPWDNKSITPLHCAAINPNVAYLKRLLTIEPNFNLEDREHRRPIHFSAVCEGVGPLEFLLDRGASPLEVDTRGMTPLHYACSAGRPRNVDILLKKSKEASAKQGDMGHQKWGPGGVDRPSRSSYCPVHIAVSYNHADVLKILIKHQVDVNKILSAGKNKHTPLMIAAGQGNLEMCKVLVQNGAHIEQLDKLKRSALIHAVLNGNTHVASYLLNLGADPNRCDSSGNSVVHYAAAYGWLHCLKLLKEADAELGLSNQWKTTPIGIAFLKGHIGIVDYLIKQKSVDIDFKNDEGLTLMSVATSSALTPGLYDQIKYLTDRKASPSIKDVNGLNALHHLARNKITKTPMYAHWGWHNQEQKQEIDEEKMELTVKIARLLLDAGCDATAETEDGKTALMFAIEQLNIKLVEVLVDAGGTVTSHKSDTGKTILHLMADLCMQSDLSRVLKILMEQKTKEQGLRQVKGKKVVIENGDIVDEPMEVDTEKSEDKADKDKPKENGSGDAKADAVNGMETEDGAPPRLEKMSSVASQEDIWPLMASEYDHQGYTPLLWACKIYKDFKKTGKMTVEEVKKSSENGRNFISSLIDLAGADVSATVGEKVFQGEAPKEEKEKYTADGKCSVLHLLLHVGHEVVEGLNCAGLEMVAKYKPDTEHRNLAKQTALALAVESNSEHALSILIKVGAEPDPVYGTEATGYFTPLHKAADQSSVKIVKMLIEAGADVKKPNTKTGEQPLNLAVHYRGDEAIVIEIAKLLLDAGAEVSAGKQPALHTAVVANQGTSNASTELEEFLISRGGDVFAKDEKNRIPLHYAFISKNKPDSVSALDPIELCSVLTDAMQNKELDARDDQGRSPLHLAAMRGATICCLHLLQRGVPILGTDIYGHTALSLAVKYKHDSCAIMLLQKGAKVDVNIVIPPENIDRREYFTTSGGKKVPVWKWKRSRYPEKTAKQEPFDPYQVAIEGELPGVAHMVLDSSGLNGKVIEAALRANKYHIALRHLQRIKDNGIVKDYRNKDGQNLLHVLALETKRGKDEALQLKIAKVLVEKGVSLSALDKFKRHPLVYVAFKHQPVGLAKFFIENSGGLDINQKDIYDRTVMVALFWDQVEIHKESKTDRKSYIKLFLDAGASLDVAYTVQWPETPLFDLAIADLPLNYFEALEHPGRLTPLMSAMYNVDLELVRFLLKNGASSNLPDQNGVTPIMHAAKLHDVRLVKILLNNDYVVPAEKDGSKPGLKKKLSRAVFEIKPVAGDQDDDDDEDGDDNDEDKDDDDDDKDDENDFDDDGGEGSDGGNDEDMEDEDEPTEDSDHDTDFVEDEEEDANDDQHLPIPRLGSKQPSIRRQGTSQLSSEKEEFETVVKTSSVDLTTADKFGWTVTHHLVSPLDYGTFDNEEILYVLAKAGAPLDKENKDGDTPLKLAQKIGAHKIVKRLQALLSVDVEKAESSSLPAFHVATEADSSLSTADANMYEADADSMVKKLTPAETEESKTKAKPKVDPQCMAAKTGEIVFDKERDVAYDIILSKIEVRSMLSDTYNFYKMQIIYHKVKDIYILFTKWGRIGDTGQYQQTPYHTLTEAVVSFCKIFKSKTGNSWSDLKSFVNQPKKYRVVQLDSQPSPVLRVDFQLESSIPSKLPVEIQDLLREMADVGMMQAAMKKAKMAEEYMPFGRIKRDILVDARKILQKIGDIVVETDKRKNNLTYDQTEHQANCEKISALSTEYYSLIPQEGYSYDKIEPLVDRSHITAELRLISNLLDLETASKVLLGAQYKLNECNPLDYMYQAIGCSITPLREDDVESQYILKYIRSSTKSSTAKVLCIHKLWRPGEDQKEKFKKLDNHKLLWHGSSMSNMIGILHNGLLVAPPEAPITGHAFGEGTYTADTFAKSNMYCYNTNPKSTVKCALLCEVALGNCKEDVDSNVEVDLINSEFNSLRIHGTNTPDEHWDLSLPYGATMPMGCTQTQQNWMSPEGEKRRWVPYTEYIVQDSDQICLRYLVQFV